jgi:hypothetical protein
MSERLKNHQWTVSSDANGKYEMGAAQLVVLQDLRDELQTIVSLFRSLPCAVRTLERIERQLKVQRRCSKHPRYTATRKPRVACAGCHRYYAARWK